MKCEYCGKEFGVTGTGRPAKFCSSACRVGHHRMAKGAESMNAEHAAESRLNEMVERRAGAEFRGSLDVYMPTTNDANISAMIGGKELPYPEGGANVLRDLEVRKVVEKVVEKVEEVKPTF